MDKFFIEKMNYKELKKFAPQNVPLFKRMFDCRKEIERINCVLVKGMISKKMFDELVLKEIKLFKEFSELDKKIFENYPFDEKWSENFFNLLGEELKKICKKFKFKKCMWCDRLFDEKYSCPNEECQSYY